MPPAPRALCLGCRNLACKRCRTPTPAPALLRNSGGTPGWGGGTRMPFYLPAGSCAPIGTGQAAAGACQGIPFLHASLPSTKSCPMHPLPPWSGGALGPPLPPILGFGVLAGERWGSLGTLLSPRATAGAGELIQDPLWEAWRRGGLQGVLYMLYIFLHTVINTHLFF